MSGYMGFGLKKWIYRQWPKRFFKLDRKPINSPIESYPTKKWDIKFPPLQNDDSKLVQQKYKLYKDENRSNSIMALCSFALIFILLWMVAYEFPYFNNPFQSQKLRTIEVRKEKFEAYYFLLKSEKLAATKKNYENAYYEYKLAHKLFPKSIYHQVELANMYISLCKDQDTYCTETLTYIYQLENKYCGHKYLSKLNPQHYDLLE